MLLAKPVTNSTQPTLASWFVKYLTAIRALQQIHAQFVLLVLRLALMVKHAAKVQTLGPSIMTERPRAAARLARLKFL